MTNWYYDAMLPRSRTRTLISTYVTVAVAGATLLSIAGYADGARTPSFDEKHEIVRTAAGFEPALLTIPVGTTVTFTTDRDEQFWPASDVHPNHLVYRDFDPRRPLQPGESWSFTFDKVGDWRLHDHLESRASGMIRVIASEHTCAPSDQDCWDKIIYERLERSGIGAALETLVRLHRSNPRFSLICHELAHDLGLKTYHLYGESFALTPKLSYCNAGFFHGYMEGYVGESFDLAAAQGFCTRVGTSLNAHYPEAEGQCRHGIGHGAMEYLFTSDPSHWKEPGDMAASAVAACMEANEGYEMVRRCAAGAFGALRDWMTSTESFAPYLEHRRLFGICASIRFYAAKEACYWEFAKFLVRSVPRNDLKHDVILKEIISPDDWVALSPYVARSWSVGIGRRGARLIEPDTLVSFCRSLPTETQSGCLAGLASGMIYAGDPDTGARRSLALCTHGLSEDERLFCFQTMLGDMSVLPPTPILREACAAAPDALKYVPPCITVGQDDRGILTMVARPFSLGDALRHADGSVQSPDESH